MLVLRPHELVEQAWYYLMVCSSYTSRGSSFRMLSLNFTATGFQEHILKCLSSSSPIAVIITGTHEHRGSHHDYQHHRVACTFEP